MPPASGSVANNRADGNTSVFSPPTVSLPKGGGAIRGMGEKFSANPVTGTGSLNVPIVTAASRSDFFPKLSLAYDSGRGNGPFGFGWSLSVPAIARKTENGLPRYADDDESDTFVLSGAEDLVPELIERDGRWIRHAFEVNRNGADYTVQRYRPRVEGLFARIERWRDNATGETHWQATSNDNVTSLYGQTFGSRISDPDNAARVFSWLLDTSYDDKGNLVIYEYKAEDQVNVVPALHERNRQVSANRYVKRIRYGNQTPYRAAMDGLLPTDWLFHVVFDYGEHHLEAPAVEEHVSWPARVDAFSSYRAGFEIRTHRLCQRVLMFHRFSELGASPCLVRSTDFEYSYERDLDNARTPIYSFLASVTQTGYIREANGGSYSKQSLPPLEFRYTEATVSDGLRFVDADSLENLPAGLDGATYQWVDLDSEGSAGILTEQAAAWFYKRNISSLPDPVAGTRARFEATALVMSNPTLGDFKSGQRLLDLAGDGQLCLVRFDRPMAGFHERDQDGQWGPFTPFASAPNVRWTDPNLRFVDLDGDGHADVLITEEQTFTWYPSLGKEGFGPAHAVARPSDEDRGPAVVFADGTESIRLADLSGDGLTDIVRIRNGEVCYWPNLGHGRFGARITMDNAPVFDHPDQFEQKRIRLADIDGSGTADIIYVGRTHITLWFNQAGNGWSGPRELPQFPDSDSVSSVSVVDLLGNGTACIVWSSPLPGSERRPMRYVDLMGGQKPHLLVSVVNNLGAEVEIEYVPSTKFYLEDRFAGQPWVARLPFPVHVVERVKTCDLVSRNRFITRYAYHHGYYDGVEREFRGFGMAEQWDTEEFAALENSTALPVSTNIDRASYVPPVHVKTWFHNGAHIAQDNISRHFAHEYYRGDASASLLPDTILPPDLTAHEQREASRALKGSVLREEVYADDGSARAGDPYRVTEHAYQMRRLQPVSDNRHAVFQSFESEVLSYHYERQSADPRIAHQLTLEVDAFGNVVKAAAVAYARRPGPGHEPEQGKTLITYTESRVANRPDEADWYRTGEPVATRTFEVTGVQLAEPFTIGGLRTAIDGASDIPYEAAPGAAVQKRLIEHLRSLYYDADLAGPLPLGDITRLALPYEKYQLAFTPGLISSVYAARVTDSLMLEARYVHSEADANWWIPSGQPVFQTAQRPHDPFYLPIGFTDPFGNASQVTYDPYHLLLTETRDPLGNTTRSKNHYRVLAPQLVTDPNGNRMAVRCDALGMMVATFVMGKPNTDDGDRFDDGSDEASNSDIPTTRLEYDLFANLNDPAHRRPVFVHTFARERHRDETSPWQEAYSYSDGFGREVQKKVQAERGEVDGEAADRRWVGSGWTIFNNKGRPVKQYEPFFSRRPEFEFTLAGVGSTLFYDPLNRVVATLHPNHTYGKVVFDSWQHTTWDVNDTLNPIEGYDPQSGALPDFTFNPADDPDVGECFRRLEAGEYLPTWYDTRMDPAKALAQWPDTDEAGHPIPGNANRRQAEHRTAEQAARHANTPTMAVLDVLGRPALTIADNGRAADGTSRRLHTRLALDIEGNQRSVIDALGRTVASYGYDMLGNRVHDASVDAGERWLLNNALGKRLLGWDDREHEVRTAYDRLQRPSHLFVTSANGVEVLAGRTVYGETLADRAAERNLRGKPYQQYDQAGVVIHEAYDFKGNLQRSRRRLAADYRLTVDWHALVDLADIAAIEDAAAPLLESEAFTSIAAHDALNRPIRVLTPHNDRRPASEIQPGYNAANLLERVDVRLRGATEWTPFVTNIDYNARGQRVRLEYGIPGDDDRPLVTTEYIYDVQTFRLARIVTTRASHTLLQALEYFYDPAGNITEIRDDAQQTIFFDNAVVEPHTRYEYDAVYRLIAATGREHIGQHASPQVDEDDSPRMNQPHPGDGQAMRSYTERFEYDPVGNILRMTHTAGQGSWTRRYAYGPASNRLLATSVPGDDPLGPFSARYEHDAHGNMTRMPHLPVMEWDFTDQLHVTQRQQVSDGGTGERTYYVYDAAGQRVRKVTNRQAAVGQTPTSAHERIYFGDFEIYRERDATGERVTLERETLHVMDDQQRVALVETKTVDTADATLTPTPVVRYQLANHLGSACLELDEGGEILSYEEYHPYGTTSYQAVRGNVEANWKRYGNAGMEKDEESGLSHHGARYYAAWLARWASCDPAGGVDGFNLYRFARNSPIVYCDPSGLQPEADLTLDEAWRMSRADRTAFSGGVSVFGDRIVPEPRTLAEHPLLGHIAREEWRDVLRESAHVTDPDVLFSRLRDRITARVKSILTEHPSHELSRLFEVARRGEREQLRFISGAFRDQWLELAHNVSREEVRRLGAHRALAADLQNLYPVGHSFHRRFLHVEQVATRWGRNTSDEAAAGLRRYADEAGRAAEDLVEEGAEKLSRRALRGLARGIVVAGIVIAVPDIVEAAEEQDYGRAVLMSVGLFVDPVDWGVSVGDLVLLLRESEAEHESRMRLDADYRAAFQRRMEDIRAERGQSFRQ